MGWIYIYEDCDMCGGRGHYAQVIAFEKIPEAECDLCQGQGRRPTNMSFYLNEYNPVNEELAAEGH